MLGFSEAMEQHRKLKEYFEAAGMEAVDGEVIFPVVMKLVREGSISFVIDERRELWFRVEAGTRFHPVFKDRITSTAEVPFSSLIALIRNALSQHEASITHVTVIGDAKGVTYARRDNIGLRIDQLSRTKRSCSVWADFESFITFTT